MQLLEQRQVTFGTSEQACGIGSKLCSSTHLAILKDSCLVHDAKEERTGAHKDTCLGAHASQAMQPCCLHQPEQAGILSARRTTLDTRCMSGFPMSQI